MCNPKAVYPKIEQRYKCVLQVVIVITKCETQIDPMTQQPMVTISYLHDCTIRKGLT